MKTIKLIINIILGIGCFLIFNESGNFTPNFIGIACLALLVVFNVDYDVIEQIRNHNKQ